MTSVPKPPPPHIVIVGGGLAGLAVASSLVDRGLRITLLESRPRLGGRASSFPDPVTGELVDNCQHVSMACCTNLADFCRRVGIDAMLRREPALIFLGPEGAISRFRTGPGPAPFHLAGSFLSARFLGLRDKLRVAYGLACLAWSRDDRPGESFADWLLRHGQTLRAINLFWGAVLVSALNERLDQMDVGHARKVFLDGFLRNRTGFQLELPLVPLGELYGTRLERWLGDHGVAVRLTTGVRAFEPDNDGATGGVVLRSGEFLAADFVILAVPFDRVPDLIPEELRDRIPDGGTSQCDAGRAHNGRPPLVRPAGLSVRPRRDAGPADSVGVQPHGDPGPDGARGDDGYARDDPRWRSVPASGDQRIVRPAVARQADDPGPVLAELAEIWPVAQSANLLRWWVVTEHGATFAVRPGIETLRPPQRTPIDGFFLAGDWTDTGWPATMEGAVRSGYLAAQEILKDLDRPTRLVRPGLRSGALARWLFGSAEFRPRDPRCHRRLLTNRRTAAIPHPLPVPTEGR